MPDFKPTQASTNLIVRDLTPKTDLLFKRLRLDTQITLTAEQRNTVLKNGSILIPGRPKPVDKNQHVVLSASQTLVEGKGELRLFNAALMHPASNTIAFDVFDGAVLIWLYGLKVGKDYSAKLKLKGFAKDVVNGPAPNENGTFLIMAGGNEFNVKPTYKEQVIPVSFIDVKDTYAMLYISGENDLSAWQFYECSVIETVL